MSRTCCLLAWALPTTAVAAENPPGRDVDLVHRSCDSGWSLSVRGRSLRDALEVAAQAADFELRYLAEVDPQRDGTYAGALDRLLVEMAKPVSLVVLSEPDPACPGQSRVARVYVLPTGEDGDLPDHTPVPEAVQIYRRAHNMDPTTGEPLGQGDRSN